MVAEQRERAGSIVLEREIGKVASRRSTWLPSERYSSSRFEGKNTKSHETPVKVETRMTVETSQGFHVGLGSSTVQYMDHLSNERYRSNPDPTVTF